MRTWPPAWPTTGSRGRVVGLVADGTGYGLDGNLWGCEVLVGDYLGFSREAHLEYVLLPGGESCIRHPRRTALSYLRQYGGESWRDIARRLFPGLRRRGGKSSPGCWRAISTAPLVRVRPSL